MKEKQVILAKTEYDEMGDDHHTDEMINKDKG